MFTKPKQTAQDQPLTPQLPPVAPGHTEFIRNLASRALENPSLLIEVGSEVLAFRRLEQGDYEKGFLDTLTQLTSVGDVSKEAFFDQFEFVERNPDYLVVVVETLSGRIIGTATLLIERKFIHKCGAVAHIEDVVVDKAYRGRKIGSRLLTTLTAVAKARGCYKAMLDCNDTNVPFYEAVGFERHSQHMALYFPSEPSNP